MPQLIKHNIIRSEPAHDPMRRTGGRAGADRGREIDGGCCVSCAGGVMWESSRAAGWRGEGGWNHFNISHREKQNVWCPL